MVVAVKKKTPVLKKVVKKEEKPRIKPSAVRMPRLSLVPQFSAPSDAPKLPARLQAAIDKSEIAEVIYTFCRGLDRMDENLLRSVCHPDATLDLGPGMFQGTSNDYVHWVLGVLQQVRSSHNLVGNVRAEIEGDVALVESYFQTHYRLDKPTGREDVFLGGRFLDRMERRPAGPTGVWKVMHRKQLIDWTRTEAVSEIFYHQNPDALWSYRTKTDPSYQMASFPGSQSGSKLPAFLGRRNESKSVKF